MQRTESRRNHLVARIEDRVRTIARSDDAWLADIVGDLANLIGADAAGAYHLEQTATGLRMDLFHAVGFPKARVISEFEAFARSKNGSYAAFDPIHPQVEQRNVALANSDIASVSGVDPRLTSTYREFLPRLGMERTDQLRALICDGDSLLAWVGGFRAGPFSDQDRRDLDAVLPVLRSRFLLDRRAADARLGSATLPAVIQAFPSVAFVVAESGRVLETNTLGREWLAEAGHAASGRLLDILKGNEEGFLVARVETGAAPSAYFVWRPGTTCRSSREKLANEWRLTPRQSVVAGLLATGKSNKEIAVELHCADKTVELHVTAILKKAGVNSRAAFIAKALSTID